MSQEQTKERIKFLTETGKILSFLIIAIGGGVSTLFLQEDKTDLHFILIYIGMPIFTIFLFLTGFIYRDINRLLKNLL